MTINPLISFSELTVMPTPRSRFLFLECTKKQRARFRRALNELLDQGYCYLLDERKQYTKKKRYISRYNKNDSERYK